jgi:ribose transport system ATP-binding protein
VREPVSNLSGGNQQKVALGRLMHQDAEILLLDQPTRGIDVAAKAEVHRLIDELAVAGRAVLLVSDDLSELLGICDRIAVMHRGVLGPTRPATEWTEASLLSAAVGAASTQDAP